MPFHPNSLYYGDNLEVLRNRDDFPNDSIDLIYLDPPFHSKRDYNVLYKTPIGHDSDFQSWPSNIPIKPLAHYMEDEINAT